MLIPQFGSAAQIVASARKKLKLKQDAFGQLIGRGQSLVSKYETGKVDPPAFVVMHCMNILSAGQALEGDVSSIEVARLVESRLEGPQFSKIRAAIVSLVECVSVVPRRQT